MKHKILIADDEESIRTVLQRVFADYIVLSAGDGEAAMRIIAAESPSLVLLDLAMPLMSGLEVLRALKNEKNAPRVIVITGDGEMEMAVKALEAGAASYVTKPFKEDVLRMAVQLLLGGIGGEKKGSAKPWQVKGRPDDWARA